MTDSKSEYEFYVGPDTLLEGASLEINGTARIDGTIVGKVTVNHLIVGPKAKVQGDIRGETALVEGTVEDTIEIKDKSKSLDLVLNGQESAERDVPDYIDCDQKKLTAKLTRVPKLEEVPYPVQMEPNLVVEFYSRN